MQPAKELNNQRPVQTPRRSALMWVADLLYDIRVAARGLRHAPVFSLATASSLAVGIALSAIAAALFNAYLLRPLPFTAADRLYQVLYAAPGQPEPRRIDIDWTAMTDVVEVPISFAAEMFYLTDGRYTEAARGLRVATDFFRGLGAGPLLGRTLVDADVGDHVAVITHAAWRHRFGSDPQIVGRTFRAYTANQAGEIDTLRIVGVLTPDFWFVRDGVEVLTPLDPGGRPYMVRLRSGVPPLDAERRLTAAARAQSPSLPDNWAGVRLELVHARYTARIERMLVAIAAAIGVMLAIVCLNVSILAVIRSFRRQRDMALRLALGATRRKIARLAVIEAGLLTGTAVAVGLIGANVALRQLAGRIEAQLGVLTPGGTTALSIDATVVLFVIGLGITIVLLLAFGSNLSLRHRLDAGFLRADLSGGDQALMRYVRHTLVVAQVAGTFALFVAGAFMIRTVATLTSTDFGFDVDGVVRAHVALPARSYATPASLGGYYYRLLDELQPSSQGVALSNFVTFYEPVKHPVQTSSGDAPAGLAAGVTAVSAGYFRVLGIPIVAGRTFSDEDRTGGAPVAVVSRALAQRLWSDGDAIGRQIRTSEGLSLGSELGTWRTIVGVVDDVRQTYVDQDLKDVYVPFFQVPNRFASIFLRSGDRPSWATTVRDAIADLDPTVTLNSVETLVTEAGTQLASSRFLMSLLSVLSGISVFLAVTGVYGVTAYVVQQRRRELALRIALGRTVRSVRVMLVRTMGGVVIVGMGFGWLLASALVKVLQQQVQGAQQMGLGTLGSAAVLVGGVATVASWLATRHSLIGDVAATLKAD